jgi:hypothetical protein
MARTWKQERTTPKQQPRKATQRPRMNEFAAQWYKEHGYTVDTVTGDARAYVEADA